ncbi:MAG TPA: hypothetical protein VFC07_14825 [Verrucomicrobiae bacterium]|nr:hypothetical protein [Verrucomicrobiae bacterium]
MNPDDDVFNLKAGSTFLNQDYTYCSFGGYAASGQAGSDSGAPSP